MHKWVNQDSSICIFSYIKCYIQFLYVDKIFNYRIFIPLMINFVLHSLVENKLNF